MMGGMPMMGGMGMFGMIMLAVFWMAVGALLAWLFLRARYATLHLSKNDGTSYDHLKLDRERVVDDHTPSTLQ